MQEAQETEKTEETVQEPEEIVSVYPFVVWEQKCRGKKTRRKTLLGSYFPIVVDELESDNSTNSLTSAGTLVVNPDSGTETSESFLDPIFEEDGECASKPIRHLHHKLTIPQPYPHSF